MKKAVAIICTIVIFAFSLIGCGDKDTVAYNLKLNVSSGEVAESFDTHGGFNGDGATFAKIKSLIPEIKNGYSMLIDKQDKSLTSMLERASLNFVLGVYDTDTNTLYYYELDT